MQHILVTNTADEGSGSLRQAILDSQSSCELHPCTIDFRIAEPSQSGRHTIRPRTPLPELRGIVKVDGPDEHDVEIDGSLLMEGNAFLLASGCELQVLDLVIHDFPWPAVQTKHRPLTWEVCRDFVDTGRWFIARNHISASYRGIALAGNPAVDIRHNVISGNLRAGIFAEGIIRDRGRW